MALTMVHLMVADQWAKGRAAFAENPEYYLGAVSPDAIHVRDHDDKSHKNAIHLNNWQSPHPKDVIAYWRDHHTPFDVGYGVHVLTDAQWVPRYQYCLPGILRADGRLNTDIYYNDTFVTDFALYDRLPRLKGLVDMIEEAEAPSDHPLLTHYEFTEWRRIIVEAYRGECPKHDPVRFVDQAYVEAFTDDAIALIDQVYREAFGD